jgi:hypothetical protein
MRPLLVVFRDPRFGQLANLIDRVEQMGIEHFLAVGTIEAPQGLNTATGPFRIQDPDCRASASIAPR